MIPANDAPSASSSKIRVWRASATGDGRAHDDDDDDAIEAVASPSQRSGRRQALD
jgi:hypothetical protein